MVDGKERLNDLGDVTLQMVRAANGLVQEAINPNDPPSPRFFALDLEGHRAEFARLFPIQRASLTSIARELGPVPLKRFGFSATSGHGLAMQVAGQVADAAHRVLRANTPSEIARVWPMVQRELKRLAGVDMEWLASRIVAEQDMLAQRPPPERSEGMIPSISEGAATSPAAKRQKRSTERGEGRTKLIAALTKHHNYADGGCLNLEPIGNNDLARLAGVAPATASSFFKSKFGGHRAYRARCQDAGALADEIKAMRGEFTPADIGRVRLEAFEAGKRASDE